MEPYRTRLLSRKVWALTSNMTVLTWANHGNYMSYLAHTPVTFLVPRRVNSAGGWCGRDCGMPLPDNVIEVAANDLPDLHFDAVLYQWHEQYRTRGEYLTDRQLRLPQLFVEHDPAHTGNPTDTRHLTSGDAGMWLIHVTHYNALMWDSGAARTRVIEHGVVVPNPRSYTGQLERGIITINHLLRRGRRLGYDLYRTWRDELPLDVVGLGAEEIGGLGPVHGPDLPAFMARYRFFLQPIRYTSLSLSLIEAMMVGLPPVALATTEVASVLTPGRTGYVSCNLEELRLGMLQLLKDREHAAAMGQAAADLALARFNIDRFAADWLDTFERATA